MSQYKVLFRDSNNEIVEKYVTLEEKIIIEKERKLNRHLNLIKHKKDPLRLTSENGEKNFRKKVLKLTKELNSVQEASKVIKDRHGINHKKKPKLPKNKKENK